jgi:hypothetical protein
MPDKYILIKKSELNRRLKSLSNSTVEMVVLRVPTIKVAKAMIELSSIDEDNWISSDTLIQPKGETTEIRVPKKAITG